MAIIGVMGVALALVYVWRGSLVARIVMHFLQDVIGIVVPAAAAVNKGTCCGKTCGL